MKQKLQDLLTLLKRDRKTQVIAGFIACAALFLLFGEGNKFRPLPQRQGEKKQTAMRDADAAWGDLQRRFSGDIDQLKTAVVDTNQRLETSINENKQTEQRVAEIMRRILERLAENETLLTRASLNGPGNPVVPGGGRPGEEEGLSQPAEPDNSLETLVPDENLVKPPPPPGPKKVAIVGAGDSVRVRLLTGVDAPTDSTPYPVVFKLTDDVHGPDGSILPLGEARLIAAAQGSLTDSRALFRLSSLNLRLPDGRRKILSVDGWVVGEDGIRGMEGITIDPLGKAIGGIAVAGGLTGLGRAISAGQTSYYNSFYGTQSVVTGDMGTYAAGEALSQGAREWSDLIKERANMLVPHIQVLSGRDATAVFSKSFTISDLIEAMGEDNQHFATLD